VRILYVAPLSSIHSRRWIGFFRDRGHEVHVLSFAREAGPQIEGVTHHELVPSPKRLPLPLDWIITKPAFFRSLRSHVDDIAPDVVHVHWIDFFAYAMARARVQPLLLTAWGSDILIKPRESLKVRYLVRTSLRHARRITCDADHMRDAIVALGAERARVEVINFGTDCRAFSPDGRDPNLARELGFPAGSPLVISLRQLKPIYDITTFIRAMPHVLARMPAARFVIASDGPDRADLERLASDGGVANAVRFTGYLSDEDLRRFTASADVYVSTSLSDGGIAASTAEAMAAGVPVVVTDFGDNGAWVRDGDTGFLFPCSDHLRLADRLSLLLGDGDMRRAIGARARRLILERNDRETEMCKVEKLYRQCAAGDRR
jgi:glycosyltransferase involved in cell wall biosynthesis